MNLAWQALQWLGSLVGLATGIFVLAERLTKHRPTVIFFSKKLDDFGPLTVYLQVTNRSDRPMLVQLPRTGVPGHFAVASSHSTRAILSAVLGGDNWTVLGAGETSNLVLLKPPDYASLDEDNEIAVVLLWQFAQPILWRGARTIRVSIPKLSYQHLARERPMED